MRLLTSWLAASVLALGACASNEQRGADIAWDSTPPGTAQGATCLPPNCAYTTGRPQTKTATSARPTVKPRH